MNISIVIPVHNQCQLLQNCINSIFEKTNTEFQIIIVNDGSDEQTTKFCHQLYETKKIKKLVHNPVAKGFSESCNQGIVASQDSDYICLLNSDTKIVTKNWLEKVILCGESDEKIGCLGVLSNCATWQSIGKNFVKESEIQKYGDLIVSLSENQYPRTNLINGFCFFIKTNVQKQVGLLDVQVFPHYGSEDDFALRIRQKGYELAIVDNVYVYHYSNQSYKEKREKIMHYSLPNLLKKWGNKRIVQDTNVSNNSLNYLKKKINEYFSSMSCDIIIVVHNALSYLKKCIESIQKYTDYEHNIFIVDNNSNEETKSYLKSLKHVQIISNKKNYGFGYSNNQAIRKSKSKYVCFLNSDTIVTKNWLTNLIECLEKNNAGIVGPISNEVSSELQKVDYLYDDNDENIQDFAEKRYLQYKDKVAEYNRLIGFCMVMKREVLQKTGCFDDRYRFNFEDDDLCLRTVEQGYRLYCSFGVFIYHYAGQSFKEKSINVDYNNMLETSRDLYKKKWYETQKIKFINEKKDNISIIYLLESNSPSGGVKVVFEHANRLKDRGYNVKIYCRRNETGTNWFDLYTPIVYFSEPQEVPHCDIAIGTYFTTLPILQKINSSIKIHLCQGYEASLYDKVKEKMLISTIQDNYKSIKEKIVVSKWLKEIIDKEYKIDSYYVPNGLDQYVFSFSKHQRNRTPRILIVGNYGLQIKGVAIALKAAEEYLKAHSRNEPIMHRQVYTAIKIVNKKVQGTIVRLASEKTQFDDKCEFHDMSKMTQDEIAKVYESCDVTLCASYKVEGFSLPPLESMASGTPVITTDCGGINDYAINNENSIIVPPGDVKALQQGLEMVLSNNELYSRLVENGLKTANEYPWYKQIDILEGFLHRLYYKQIALSREQLSVCMIVKNEQLCLANCLESIKGLANEIIIVDTGSTDDTIRIAKSFGAKIFHFEWIDDFSAARNFALEKVTQSWTFILDADEVISPVDISKIRNLLKQNKAYSFVSRNYVNSTNIEDVVCCKGEYKNEEKDFVGWCRSGKVRLFPTTKGAKFNGQIHELVEDSLEELNIKIEMCDIPVHHYGYLKQNKEKGEIYLKLGKNKAKVGDKKALYELASQYMALNNYDESLVVWRRLLSIEPKNYDYLSHIGTVFNLLNDYDQAEKYFLKSISICQSEYAFKHLAICYSKLDRYNDAYLTFKKIVYKTDDLKTMADFAYCCNTLKKYDEAISILEKCLKINREITVSWGLLESAYNEKGIEFASANNLNQALVMFKKALDLDCRFEAAQTNLNVVNKLLSTGSFSKSFIKV
jgi:GT2 family glycosyltransferase/glycosyltransferase involved in cell wall biosynthesis/Tfp pilus assembly protein PilF